MIKVDSRMIDNNLVSELIVACVYELSQNNKLTVNDIAKKITKGNMEFIDTCDNGWSLELAIAYNIAAYSIHIENFKEYDITNLYELRKVAFKNSRSTKFINKLVNFGIFVGSFALNGISWGSFLIGFATLLVYPFLYLLLLYLCLRLNIIRR